MLTNFIAILLLKISSKSKKIGWTAIHKYKNVTYASPTGSAAPPSWAA